VSGLPPTSGDAGRGVLRRWRLSFPPDGAAVFALDGPFDAAATTTLRSRIDELTADLRLGLVIDLGAAGELDAEQQGRLLRVVATARAGLAVAAIVRDPDALRERIFAAHRDLRLWPVATAAEARVALHAAAPPPAAAPWAPVGAGDDLASRRRRAVARSLHWAARSAAIGDYADALGWLELVEAVDGTLAPEWCERRRSWERGVSERAR